MTADFSQRRPRAFGGSTLVDSSWQLGPLAGRVPIAILVPTLLLLIAQLGREALGRGETQTAQERAPSAAIVGSVIWLVALVGGILLVGMPLGVGSFILIWLIGRARVAWWRAGGVPPATIGDRLGVAADDDRTVADRAADPLAETLTGSWRPSGAATYPRSDRHSLAVLTSAGLCQARAASGIRARP